MAFSYDDESKENEIFPMMTKYFNGLINTLNCDESEFPVIDNITYAFIQRIRTITNEKQFRENMEKMIAASSNHLIRVLLFIIVAQLL